MSEYYRCNEGQGSQQFILFQGNTPRCAAGGEWISTDQLVAEIVQEPAMQQAIEQMGYPGMIDLVYIGISFMCFAAGWNSGVSAR